MWPSLMGSWPGLLRKLQYLLHAVKLPKIAIIVNLTDWTLSRHLGDKVGSEEFVESWGQLWLRVVNLTKIANIENATDPIFDQYK